VFWPAFDCYICCSSRAILSSRSLTVLLVWSSPSIRTIVVLVNLDFGILTLPSPTRSSIPCCSCLVSRRSILTLLDLIDHVTIALSRKQLYYAYTESLGIVLKSAWPQVASMSDLADHIAMVLGIAMLIAEVVTIAVFPSYEDSYVFLFLSQASQIIVGFMIFMAIATGSLSLLFSSSSMDMSHITAIERQNRALSDNASIFSITSLMKSRSDLRQQKHVRFMSRQDHSLSGKSIAEVSDENDEDSELSFGVGIRKVYRSEGNSVASSQASEIPKAAAASGVVKPLTLSLDQTLSEISSLSASQAPVLSIIPSVISSSDTSSDIRFHQTADRRTSGSHPMINGVVVSDRVTAIIFVIIAVLAITISAADVSKQADVMIVLSSVILRIMEIAIILMSLSDLRVTRSRWRVLAKRTLEGATKTQDMEEGKEASLKTPYAEQVDVVRQRDRRSPIIAAAAAGASTASTRSGSKHRYRRGKPGQ
jgi:hypothetical protein